MWGWGGGGGGGAKSLASAVFSNCLVTTLYSRRLYCWPDRVASCKRTDLGIVLPCVLR